jgi:Holliday junction DNA helicase RuvA
VISLLTGQVQEIGIESAVLIVGGVGFEVSLAPRQLAQLRVGDEASIYTRMIVKEDDIALYGFASKVERDQFDLLCSVSGIGPRLAMTVIAGLDPDSFADAINKQDEQVFRNIVGIGPKTAKLILLSLAGKTQQVVSPTAHRVLLALKQLGTDESRARSALSRVDNSLSESEMLKQALKLIGGAMS